MLTRLKQGELWGSMKRLRWSAVELSRRARVPLHVVIRALNLTRRPTAVEANKIQKAFAEAGEYIDVLSVWPEAFRGFVKVPVIEHTQEVPTGRLLGSAERCQLPAFDTLAADVEGLLADLPPRLRHIMVRRYLDEWSVEEIAAELGIRSKDYIYQTLRTVHHRFRHVANMKPEVVERLREYTARERQAAPRPDTGQSLADGASD